MVAYDFKEQPTEAAKVLFARTSGLVMAKARAVNLGIDIPPTFKAKNNFDRAVYLVTAEGEEKMVYYYGDEWRNNQGALIFMGACSLLETENWVPLISLTRSLEMLSGETALVQLDQIGSKEWLWWANLITQFSRNNQPVTTSKVIWVTGDQVEAWWWQSNQEDLKKIQWYFGPRRLSNLTTPEAAIPIEVLKGLNEEVILPFTNWLLNLTPNSYSWANPQAFIKSLNQQLAPAY